MKVHSKPGDLLLDFFAGSGTLGEAAANHGRDYLLIDNNPEAIQVMTRRLSPTNPDLVGCGGIRRPAIENRRLHSAIFRWGRERAKLRG